MKSELHHLTVGDLSPILAGLRRSTVTVIKAPPGLGKSTALYTYIAQRTEQSLTFEPRPFRVLWATHGTLKPNSLGQEAKSTLNTHMFFSSAHTAVIYGKESFRGPQQAYLQQHDWNANPLISTRIISHSHLPSLFHPDALPHFTSLVDGTDLIVIDEDPLLPLIFSLVSAGRKVTFKTLQQRNVKGQSGTVEAAVQAMMADALTGHLTASYRYEHRISGVETNVLSGPEFWEALQVRLTTTPDWDKFSSDIVRVALGKNYSNQIAIDMARMLEEDFAALGSGRFSFRFGLVWETGRPDTMVFQANFLRPQRKDMPPIVILDAYADPKMAVSQHLTLRQKWRPERSEA